MRGLVFVTFVLVAAVAYACDSFSESNDQGAADAGDDRSSVDPDATPPDAGVDQNVGCQPEPEWVTPDAGQVNVSCGGASVSLLNDPKHCGRCNHSCGADSCVAGTCTEKKEDDGAVLLGAVHQGALYYARRPGGVFSSEGHELKRFVPGMGSFVLASFGADAGNANGEKTILGGAAFGDDVYVRTTAALWKASATTPSATVPTLVTTLPSENASSIATDGNRVFVALPSNLRIDQVNVADGGVSPFITDGIHAGESRYESGRYLWIKQAFVFTLASDSSVHMRVGDDEKLLLDSQDKIGGLAVDGNELFVMRAGPAGAIIRIDLSTLATQPFFEGNLDNSVFSIAVAVDSTHVYWLKDTNGNGGTTEIWKRARCGGEAVRIGRHPNAYRLLTLGDQLFIGAADGLFSIAK